MIIFAHLHCICAVRLLIRSLTFSSIFFPHWTVDYLHPRPSLYIRECFRIRRRRLFQIKGCEPLSPRNYRLSRRERASGTRKSRTREAEKDGKIQAFQSQTALFSPGDDFYFFLLFSASPFLSFATPHVAHVIRAAIYAREEKPIRENAFSFMKKESFIRDAICLNILNSIFAAYASPSRALCGNSMTSSIRCLRV